MKAGRELDILVAKEVMGWKWLTSPSVIVPPLVAHYSTNISDAWEVMDKLCDQNRDFAVDYVSETNKWCAKFSVGKFNCRKFAGTAPLAICLAALACLSAHVPNQEV